MALPLGVPVAMRINWFLICLLLALTCGLVLGFMFGMSVAERACPTSSLSSPLGMNKSENRFQVFAREYVKDLNGKRAAMEAGYSESTAAAQASRLLTKSNVKALVAKLKGKLETKLDISAERTLNEIGLLAFSNMMDYMEKDESGRWVGSLKNLTRDQAAAIQEIREDHTGGAGDGERRLVLRTTFKLSDKHRALESLGRFHKLFTDRIEIKDSTGRAERIAKARKAVSDG